MMGSILFIIKFLLSFMIRHYFYIILGFAFIEYLDSFHDFRIKCIKIPKLMIRHGRSLQFRNGDLKFFVVGQYPLDTLIFPITNANSS
jgi:hypothetical protein